MQKQPSGKRPKNCHADPKSPFWQYDFIIDGVRERGSTRETTARDASAFVEGRKALLRKRQSENRNGYGHRLKQPITVVAACDMYEQRDPSIKHDTTISYQLANLVAILNEHDDARLISDVTTADMQRYRLRRKTMKSSRPDGVCGASINREIELARRVWRYADLLGYDVGDTPLWTKVLDKTAEVSRIRELSAAEENRLLAALERINPDLRAMTEFALLSGQRKSAVVTLTWQQVDLPNREATVLLKTRGTNKRRHTFPLTDKMIAIIESRPKVSPFVFTYECRRNAPARADRARRVAGVRFPFSKGGWARQWQAALSAAGVKDFRWHDLRHTAATRLLRQSNNLKAAQALLGHSTLEQTARYAHVFTDDLRKMMETADREHYGREREQTLEPISISA